MIAQIAVILLIMILFHFLFMWMTDMTEEEKNHFHLTLKEDNEHFLVLARDVDGATTSYAHLKWPVVVEVVGMLEKTGWEILAIEKMDWGAEEEVETEQAGDEEEE